MDRIIENLPKDIDELYIVHELGTNASSLTRDDGM